MHGMKEKTSLLIHFCVILTFRSRVIFKISKIINVLGENTQVEYKEANGQESMNHILML